MRAEQRYYKGDASPGLRDCTAEVEAMRGLLTVFARMVVAHSVEPVNPELMTVARLIADRPSVATDEERIREWAAALPPW